MSDFEVAVIAAFIGFAGSALLMIIRDIYLYNERTNKEMRRKIVEKQLDCLYSPLYRFVKSGEENLGKKTLKIGKSSKEEGEGREKEYLDGIIEKYLYLASEDLQPQLVKLHGAGFYHFDNPELLVDTIVNDYEKLRKEYFEFGK